MYVDKLLVKILISLDIWLKALSDSILTIYMQEENSQKLSRRPVEGVWHEATSVHFYSGN